MKIRVQCIYRYCSCEECVDVDVSIRYNIYNSLVVNENLAKVWEVYSLQTWGGRCEVDVSTCLVDPDVSMG